MKKVKAFIEKGTDGTYGVYVDLDDNTLNYGVHGDGNTIQEAIEDFNLTYEEMKEFHKQDGKKFVEAVFQFCYDIPSFLSYYSQFLSLVGMQKITGVHKAQLSHYLTGHRKPSAKTAEKIAQNIQAFGRELAHLEFA